MKKPNPFAGRETKAEEKREAKAAKAPKQAPKAPMKMANGGKVGKRGC